MTATRPHTTQTVLIMNPRSGNGDHGDTVRDRAALLDYSVRETRREDHAIELAASAVAGGADEVVAVGGDGTLNEVIRGVDSADALDRVTVAVIPAGTGNDFATNLGIASIDDGFQVLEDGKRRRLDLGMAGDTPFVNSCVAGITAMASEETSSDMKSRYGGLAYVITTLQTAREFAGLDITASVVEGEGTETVWEGDASVVLVGNGRRFSFRGSEQANLEDGLLDVTIIEDASALELAGDRLVERLFDREGDHHERILASSIELAVAGDESTSFSLDGEILSAAGLTLSTRHGALEMPVGETYEQAPRVD